MAMSPYYVQYLLTQGDLFGRILSFNADFASKQRDLRLQQNPNEITDSLYRLHPELARFHEEHNISYYFERPVDRYCLLKNDELDQLIIYLGACISSQQLARISAQSELDQVYNSIGRDVYNFALDYGYLIKNFDYEPNLDALKQDCAYLGLCALKSLNSLFSLPALGEYFTEKLIAYTRERKLNPSIITAHTHVLSTVVDTPATLMKAPAPEVMNTPVQYAPIDAHPARDPAQALSARTLSSAERNDPVMSAPPLTNADLAQRRLELEHKRQSSQPNLTPFEKFPVPALGIIGGTKVVAMSDGVNAYKVDSDEERAHIEATLAQYTPEQLQALTQKHHTVALNAEGPEAQAPASAPESDADSGSESANAASDPSELDAMPPAADGATERGAPDNTHDNAPDSASDGAQLTTAQVDTAQLDTAQVNTAQLDTAQVNTAQLDTAQVNTAQLNTAQLDYAQTALYAGINTKERRAFRAASRRQHEAYQDLVHQPERPRESLEHETLVTLDFSAHQVLELSTLILQSQINECWYEYLKP